MLNGLHDIHSVSKKNNIRYYAAYGTLIGAIREKGMIPWDRDADILVNINDYEKLLQNMNNYNNGFKLYKLSNSYEHLFSRYTIQGHSHLEDGCSIDLFPLVGLPRGKYKIKLFRIIAKINFKCYFAKKIDLRHYKSRKMRGIQVGLVKFLLLPIPKSLLINIYIKQCKMYDIDKSEKVYNICGSYGANEVFESDWFKATEEVIFESQKINIPAGYDEILRQLYGDYMVKKKENYLND